MKNIFYAAIIFGLLTACNSEATTETTTPETVATPAPEAETAPPAEETMADTSVQTVDSSVVNQ